MVPPGSQVLERQSKLVFRLHELRDDRIPAQLLYGGLVRAGEHWPCPAGDPLTEPEPAYAFGQRITG